MTTKMATARRASKSTMMATARWATTTTTTTTTADQRTTIPKGVIVARREWPSDGRGIAGVTTTTTMGGPGNDDIKAVGRFARAGRR
jgi:hypothetical protein